LPRLSERTRSALQNPIRAGTVAAVAAVVVLLTVAALVFTNASSSKSLIDDAQILRSAEAALGANDIALKALTQAVLLAEDELFGVADKATVSISVAEAERTTTELDQASSTLQALLAEPGPLEQATEAAVETSSEVIVLINDDRVEDAGELLAGPAKTRSEALRDTLSIQRDETASALADADRVTGILVSIARYVLALLIPGVAILAYRFMARRQLRFAEVELDARLDAEHEVVRAKDEFIANISHELRTPLTSIFGFSELLLEQGLVDPEMTTELIGVINTESGELTRLVEDLLTSAQAEANSLTFQVEAVSIPAELDAVVLQLSRAGLSATTDCDDALALGDPLRVRQVLRNLVSNAQRHGGQDIRVTGYVRGGAYELSIEDDGPGVSPDIAPRLFSRFVHLGEAPLTTGSIGLGLAVVKILVDGMNGTVRYERSDGWTRFIVRLPLAATQDRNVIESHPQELSDEVA
jgi:signal transduction histidine kinase